MTSPCNESSGSKCHTSPEARTNFASINVQFEEGCPVVNECGTICGETKTLTIFQEFRKIYDDCLQKMECIKDDSSASKKLAPFKKLVENLWEQNTMLVETVEELEQEATNRVEMLQKRLDQCCEKVDEYVQDIESLVEIIRRFREKGVLDSSGLKFNTICDLEIYGCCTSSCNAAEEVENKGKTFNENSRDSKRFRKKVLRDSSTNTKEISMITNTTTDKYNSSQNDYMTPKSECNELNLKFLTKTASKNIKNTKLNEGKCSDPLNDHYSVRRNYKTSSGMEASDKIKNKSCKTLDNNTSSVFTSFHHSVRPEECEKNFSNFHSAVNCSDEKNFMANKSIDKDSKFIVANLKCQETTINSSSKEMCSNMTYTSGYPENFTKAENKCRGTCFDFGKSININLNLLRESCCLKSDFNECDCDCNICGSYRDI